MAQAVAHPHPPLRLAAIAGSILALAGLVGSVVAQTPVDSKAPPPRQPDPAPPPPPPPPAAAAPIEDGPSFEVSSIRLRYVTDAPGRASIEDLGRLLIRLGVKDGVYVAPRDGIEVQELRIDEMRGPQRASRRFAVSAINAVASAVVSELNRSGVIGVLVVPSPDQIDANTLQDLRGSGDTTLTLDIWTRTVRQVRSLGAGERWSGSAPRGDAPSLDTRVDSPAHKRIRENSPLQPATADQPGDLLRKDALDAYLFRLNRHPGRRVDASVSSTDVPGEVTLDYIVTENKPWTIYAQVSNTGTRQTNPWRERFGFVHNQLTGRDDTLALDFVTASFDQTNGISGSYEAPVLASQTWRFRLFGSWSEYKASDVGRASESFSGDSYQYGGELIANVFQRRQLFVDLFGGARWQNVSVTNDLVNLTGDENFLIPYIGVRIARDTFKASTSAEARVEASWAGVAGTNSADLNSLGRLFADDDWTVFKWDVSQSFYLEPLLMGRAWEDPSTPERKATLAHEVAISFRGQHAFGSRLIPQEEYTIGGQYTVRGYPESIVAGDNAVLASAEYRFHWPRTWTAKDPATTPFMGKPFRWSPESRYGRPDWDLIFRGFLDVGWVGNSDRQTFEKDETLVGTGVGVEFQFRRNLGVRLDWGVALQDASDYSAGRDRFHLVATLLY
ncbi:MAG: ShlB/FhaC/HecB family hemolysin secretion/activation protein [Phycisphaerae bacterium]|nr:ShlB/FhaC/HecB family hemolysin secretion/activation protein [Phycisphaerae bacterium]